MQPGDAPYVTQPLQQEQQVFSVPSSSQSAQALPAPAVYPGAVHPGAASTSWTTHAADPQQLAAASQAYASVPAEQRQQFHDLIQQELVARQWQLDVLPAVGATSDSMMQQQQQQPSPQLDLLLGGSRSATAGAARVGGDATLQQRDDTPLRLVVTPTPLFGLSQQSPTGLLLSPPAPAVLTTPGGGDQNSLPPLGGKLASSTTGRQADAKRRCSTGRPRVPIDAKPPAVDTSVAWLTVGCGNLRGKLTLVDMLVEVQDEEGLRKVAPSKFEALAGKATTRKWRRSLVVLPEGPFCHISEPVTLGDWLKRFQLDHPMLSPKDWPSVAAAAAAGSGGGGQSSQSRGSDPAGPYQQASDTGYPSGWLGGSLGSGAQRGPTLSGASGRATDSSTTSPGGAPSGGGVMLTQYSSSHSPLLPYDATTAVSTAAPHLSPAGGAGGGAAGHPWGMQQLGPGAPLVASQAAAAAVPGGTLSNPALLGSALSDPFAALGVSAPWGDRSPAPAVPLAPQQQQQQPPGQPWSIFQGSQQQLSQQSGTPQMTQQFHQASPARPPAPQRRTVTVQVPSGDATGSDSGPLSQPSSAPPPRRSSGLAGRPRSAGADVGRQRGGVGSSGTGGGIGPRESPFVNVACDQLRGRLDLNKMTITVQTGEFAGHLLSPSRFEQLGGRGNTRKWRRSLTVVPDHPSQEPSMTLGEWIKQWQADQAAAAARVSEPESGEGLEWGEGEEGQRPRRRRPPAIMQPDVAWEPDAARKQRRTRKLRTPSSAPAVGSASTGLLPSPAIQQGGLQHTGAGFSPVAAAAPQAWQQQQQQLQQQQQQQQQLQLQLQLQQQQQHQEAQLQQQQQQHAAWQLQAASMFPAVAADPASYVIPPPPFSSWGLAAAPPPPEQQQQQQQLRQQQQQQQHSLPGAAASWATQGSHQGWPMFAQQQQQQQAPYQAQQQTQQPAAWLAGPAAHSYEGAHQGPPSAAHTPQVWQAGPGGSFSLGGWPPGAAGASQGAPGGLPPVLQQPDKGSLAVPMEDVAYDMLADVYTGGLAGDPTLSISEGDLSEVLRELGSSGNTPRGGGAATPSTRRFNPFQLGHGGSGGGTEGRSTGGGDAGPQGGVFDFSGSRGGGMRPPSVTLPPWSPTLPSSGSGSDKNSRSTPGSGGSVVDPLLHGVLGRGSFDASGLLRLEGEDLLTQPPGPMDLRAGSLGQLFGAGLPPMPPVASSAAAAVPPHQPEQPAAGARATAALPSGQASGRSGAQADPPGPAGL